MNCPKCNQPIEQNAKFCAGCGTTIDATEQPTPAVPVPEQAVSTPTPSPKKNNAKVFLVLGGLGVLILLIILGFVFLFSDKKEEADLNESTMPSGWTPPLDPEAPEEPSQDQCEKQWQDLLAKHKRDFSDCNEVEMQAAGCNIEGKDQKKQNLVIIMDSSGSMAAQISGKSRMEIAKQAIKNHSSNLSEKINTSLIVYGHKGGNNQAQKAASCAGIEEVYTLGPHNSGAFNSKIDTLAPVGWTPIEASLVKAQEILRQYPADQYENKVMLISDGEETCDGDPIAKAKELSQSSIGLIVNVVGFDVGGVAESQLKNIATGSGGEYFSARSQEELDEILNKIAQYDCYFGAMMTHSENFFDVIKKSNECSKRKDEEWFAMMDDIGANIGVSKECKFQVKGRFNERQDQLKKQIKDMEKRMKAINDQVANEDDFKVED